jgi:hypothetical protein
LATVRYYGGITRTTVASIVYSLGAGWPLLLFGLRQAPRFVRQTVVFLLPVFGSLLIATDWIRMLTYGFPVVIPAIMSLPFRRLEATLFLALNFAVMTVIPPWPPTHAKFIALFLLWLAATGIGLRVWWRGRSSPCPTDRRGIDGLSNSAPTRTVV